MLVNPDPRKIEIDYPLASLIDACERQCVAGCCGQDAYDFSPLFIAAYLSTHCGQVRSEDIDSVRAQITKIRREYCTEPLQNIEYTLTIERINQHYTSLGLDKMLAEIDYNLDRASAVWELSNATKYKEAEQVGDGDAEEAV